MTQTTTQNQSWEDTLATVESDELLEQMAADALAQFEAGTTTSL